MKTLLILLATTCVSTSAQLDFLKGGAKQPNNSLGGLPKPISEVETTTTAINTTTAIETTTADPEGKKENWLYNWLWDEFTKDENYTREESEIRKKEYLKNITMALDNFSLGGLSNPVSEVQTTTTPAPENKELNWVIDQLWYAFTKDKNYTKEESEMRKEEYLKNIGMAINYIVQAAINAITFVLRINVLAGLLFSVFNELYNGFKIAWSEGPSKASPYQPKAASVPESIDWREMGAVTPVKDQKECACCWAVSVAGALEGLNFRKTGKLEEVSIQNLLDCTTGEIYRNKGCAGGLTETAFDYVQNNQGITKEAKYPFEAKIGTCRFQKDHSTANSTGYLRIPEGDEKNLEKALAAVGPISIAIHVVPSFQLYGDGIFYDPSCSNKTADLNHAMLLVGYGKEFDGRKYWIIKNSYGTGWGEQGYLKLAKDADNHCGIATYARFPVV